MEILGTKIFLKTYYICITKEQKEIVMLNVRLNDDQEKELADYCERANRTKSEVVKEALTMYLTAKSPTKSPFELGEDLFGQESGGESAGSSQYKAKLKGKLREKHSH